MSNHSQQVLFPCVQERRPSLDSIWGMGMSSCPGDLMRRAAYSQRVHQPDAVCSPCTTHLKVCHILCWIAPMGVAANACPHRLLLLELVELLVEGLDARRGGLVAALQRLAHAEPLHLQLPHLRQRSTPSISADHSTRSTPYVKQQSSGRSEKTKDRT